MHKHKPLIGGFGETKKRNSAFAELDKASEKSRNVNPVCQPFPCRGLHFVECHFDVLNNSPNIHFPIRGYYTRSFDLLFIPTELTAAIWVSTEVQFDGTAFLP